MLNERLVKYHGVMFYWKQNLKDRALLSNMTYRKPIICNKTRWCGNYETMVCFLREYKHLTNCFNHKDSNLNFDTIRSSRIKVEKDVKTMLPIQMLR